MLNEKSAVVFLTILSVFWANLFLNPVRYPPEVRLGLPVSSSAPHWVWVVPLLQTNAGKQFCRPIRVRGREVMVQSHLDPELWVGGSLYKLNISK